MSKSVKIWLITAAALVVLGAMVFGAAACSAGCNIAWLGTGEYETNAHEITEDFSGISVYTDTSKVVFAPSEDEKCTVVCYEEKKKRHSVSVENGVLTVELVDTRSWFERISWFGNPKITVYLPKTEYFSLVVDEATGDVEIPNGFNFNSVDVSVSTGSVRCLSSAKERMKISTSTGNVSLDGVSTGSLNISVTTGRVTTSNVTCGGDVTISVSTGRLIASDITCSDFSTTGSTGEVSLKNVIAAGSLSIDRSTGRVDLDDCDAADVRIITSTGSVSGTLLSEKVFIARSNTGDIDVPQSATGGRCEITTTTGDIKIRIN